MKKNEIDKWQAALRTVFPRVVVRENMNIANDGGDPVLDVFWIPDSKAFAKFVGDDVWLLAKKRNLPAVHFIPHSVSGTQEHYPEITPIGIAPAKARRKRTSRAAKHERTGTVAKH